MCPTGSTRDPADGLCYTATREVVEAVCASGTPDKNEQNETVCFAPVVCPQGSSFNNVTQQCTAGCPSNSITNSFGFCVFVQVCPSGFVGPRDVLDHGSCLLGGQVVPTACVLCSGLMPTW